MDNQPEAGNRAQKSAPERARSPGRAEERGSGKRFVLELDGTAAAALERAGALGGTEYLRGAVHQALTRLLEEDLIRSNRRIGEELGGGTGEERANALQAQLRPVGAQLEAARNGDWPMVTVTPLPEES